MTGESAVRIGLLLPDLLGTYGDCGNAEILQRRLQWRGFPATVVPITVDDAVADSLDVYVIGGGEDSAQSLAADFLARQAGLARAVGRGAPVLAVCAGLQVLGREFTTEHGRVRTGLGVLDLVTTPARDRAVGGIRTRPVSSLLTESLTGFENHQGHSALGPAAQPLGRIEHGTGNGDGFDGAIQGRVVGTYLHGPALARNPELADLLLNWAVGAPLRPLEVPGLAELRRQRLSRPWRRR
ncbi:glutamine amidotransferase [Amycolatopsis ultiminotia]|uniref:Lipid II isoglutaminyl synthase (glutamine-hydrolyzing) subunit GatD n=1 Tax=Amycolatopsis ultiminotia TaxID=543629 RepID=A0ABP6WHE8_9PSEU